MSYYKIAKTDYGEAVSDGLDGNFQSGSQSTLDSGTYYGNRIVLAKHGLKRTLMQTLPNATIHQSMAIYGNYCVLCHSTGAAQLYNISTNTRIASVTIPTVSGFSTPHANVAQFGVEKASGNTAMPLLYLSQWDGQHGFIAYNLTSSGTCTAVQTIKSTVSSDKFGAGQTDWVIDTDNGLLYSLAYKTDNGYADDEEEGGCTMVCKFTLPKISDGASIVLTDDDLLDNFVLPPFCVRQDICYSNGHIFVAAGGGSANVYKTEWNKIYVVDLLGKCVSAVVDIYEYLQAEPEGLSVYNGKLIMTYMASNYGRLFSYEF